MFLFSPRVRVRINALMTLMTLPICTIVGLASKHSLPPSATRAPAGEWPQDPKRPQATTEQQPASSQGTVHGSRHFKVPEGPWTIKNYSIVLQLFGLRWQLQFNKHPQTSINKWIANWNIWNTKWDPSVFAPPPHRSCHLESDHRWSILELCKRGITGHHILSLCTEWSLWKMWKAVLFHLDILSRLVLERVVRELKSKSSCGRPPWIPVISWLSKWERDRKGLSNPFKMRLWKVFWKVFWKAFWKGVHGIAKKYWKKRFIDVSEWHVTWQVRTSKLASEKFAGMFPTQFSVHSLLLGSTPRTLLSSWLSA